MRNPEVHVYMHQLRWRYFITCVTENRQPEWSQCCDMDAMFSCVFNLRDVRIRIAITLKKKSVSRGGFIREKSVKEELKNLLKTKLQAYLN